MLAQATPDIILQLAGSLGVGGALVWYLYYTTSVTIPNLTQKHTDAVQKIVDGFTTSLTEERASRRQELKELQDSITADRLCKWREQAK